MDLQEIFEEAKTLTGEDAHKFWAEMRQAFEHSKPFRGFAPEEISAYLNTKPNEKCPCGNELYNCICYTDAE